MFLSRRLFFQIKIKIKIFANLQTRRFFKLETSKYTKSAASAGNRKKCFIIPPYYEASQQLLTQFSWLFSSCWPSHHGFSAAADSDLMALQQLLTQLWWFFSSCWHSFSSCSIGRFLLSRKGEKLNGFQSGGIIL